MSRFLTSLVVELADSDDDGKWRLVAPLVYESDAAQRTVVVPAGFVTDFASVPRVPVAYLLTGGTSNEAAVVHDYLYSTGIVPRTVADAVLREASAVTGVPAWRRWMMWAGVRVFGASHFTDKPVTEFCEATAAGSRVVLVARDGKVVDS